MIIAGIDTKSMNIADTVERSPYVLFPLKYPELWRAYKLAQSSFWTADEVDLTEDAKQWQEMLTADERAFISTILGFFAASDGIVVENLAQRFCWEVDIPEARCFYGYQIMVENIHAEVYSRLIQELVRDVVLQNTLFNALETMPEIKAKAEWCIRWIKSTEVGLPVRLIAFAIVEGVFFSSSFAALFWLRHRNLMPGLTFSNELIARDEGQHTAFACLLYRYLPSHVPQAVVSSMVEEAVRLEKAFFRAALPRPLTGMNSSMMDEYVEYVADFLLNKLSCPNMFNAKNPFPFMERTAIDTKTNFFERPVSEYHGALVHSTGI